METTEIKKLGSDELRKYASKVGIKNAAKHTKAVLLQMVIEKTTKNQEKVENPIGDMLDKLETKLEVNSNALNDEPSAGLLKVERIHQVKSLILEITDNNVRNLVLKFSGAQHKNRRIQVLTILLGHEPKSNEQGVNLMLNMLRDLSGLDFSTASCAAIEDEMLENWIKDEVKIEESSIAAETPALPTTELTLYSEVKSNQCSDIQEGETAFVTCITEDERAIVDIFDENMKIVATTEIKIEEKVPESIESTININYSSLGTTFSVPIKKEKVKFAENLKSPRENTHTEEILQDILANPGMSSYAMAKKHNTYCPFILSIKKRYSHLIPKV